MTDLAKDLARAERLFLDNSLGDRDYLKGCICNRSRHQRRLRSSAVDVAADTLLNARIGGTPFISNKRIMHSFRNFEELYDWVYSVISMGATGIGNCTVYDTCLRLGHNMTPKVEPRDYVYIHRCVKDSAIRILGAKAVRGKFRVPRACFDAVEKDFSTLTAVEIEDFLCVVHPCIVSLYP
ncbi:MAG: hypothetical protein IJ636_07220 [Bacteroidales bacterium]|nr:hypothetical protein [Bacteroidales bacterium]